MRGASLAGAVSGFGESGANGHSYQDQNDRAELEPAVIAGPFSGGVLFWNSAAHVASGSYATLFGKGTSWKVETTSDGSKSYLRIRYWGNNTISDAPLDSGGLAYWVVGPELEPDRWYYVTWSHSTYIAGVTTLALNGLKCGTAAMSETITNGADYTVIGGRKYGTANLGNAADDGIKIAGAWFDGAARSDAQMAADWATVFDAGTLPTDVDFCYQPGGVNVFTTWEDTGDHVSQYDLSKFGTVTQSDGEPSPLYARMNDRITGRWDWGAGGANTDLLAGTNSLNAAAAGLTVAALVFIGDEDLLNARFIFAKGAAASSSWSLRAETDGNLYFRVAGTQSPGYDFTSQYGKWLFVVGTLSGNGSGETVRLHVNGGEVGSGTGSCTWSANTVPWAIGNDRSDVSASDPFYYGMVAGIAQDDEEWTAAAIAAEYAAIQSNDGRFTPARWNHLYHDGDLETDAGTGVAINPTETGSVRYGSERELRADRAWGTPGS